jgi:hypothetical protein
MIKDGKAKVQIEVVESEAKWRTLFQFNLKGFEIFLVSNLI